VRDRSTVIQKKTGRPVQFEITEQTRASIREWLPSVHPNSISSPVGSGCSPTSRPDNMHGSSTAGSRASGSTALPTAPTRCGGRRPRRSTRKRVTCGRFSFC
jgi:hypothetical protein